MSAVRKFRFAAFEVDLDNRELRKRGLRLKLQQKPFQILEMLLCAPGQLVMRAELARRLWPDLHVSFDRSLNTAINTLRQVLGDSPQNPRFIETRPGLGYIFIAPVEDVTEAKDTHRAPARQPVAGNAAGAAAAQDCLKGRYFCNRFTEEDLHKGVAHFEAALAQDPGCALAYAGLADAHRLFAVLNMATAKDAYPRAQELALSAIRLDKDLGEAHCALAGVKRMFEWDWLGAGTEYRAALELSPASAAVRGAYGSYLAAIGRAEDAARELRCAHENDLLSPMPDVQFAWSLYMARDFQGASEQSWKILAMEPQFAAAQHTLGLAYEQMGMIEEAVVELQNARTCAGEQPAVLASLAHAYATAGSSREACDTLSALQRVSRQRYVSPYWQGLVYAGMGDYARALKALRRAREERDVWLTWLNVEPRLDRLREEAGFHELLRAVGPARSS